MKLLYLLFLGTLGVSQIAFPEEVFYPSNVLMLDSQFSHHVILVEKSTHKLHIYENTQTIPKLIKSFPIATGKFRGNKDAQGDHKTPEGVYTIYEFLSENNLKNKYGDLSKMYGAGAFPMDYPNFIDRRLGKTGGGIWLHSTDDDSRVFKGLDSRGCVVVQNQDLKEIAQFIELNKTPIIIVQDIYFLNQTTWEKNRQELESTLSNWMNAWKNKNFNDYINSYHQEEFYDRSKGNFKNYKAYKNAVFSRPDKPEITFSGLSVLVANDYAMATFKQDYRSNVINDIGKKTLYLKKDKNYNWKIVGELWSKYEESALTFAPAQRFFE